MATSRVRGKAGHGSIRDESRCENGVGVRVGVVRRRSRQIIIPEMIFSPFISLRRLPQLNLSDSDRRMMMRTRRRRWRKKKMEKIGSRKIVGVR